jgi:hypothetical protein
VADGKVPYANAARGAITPMLTTAVLSALSAAARDFISSFCVCGCIAVIHGQTPGFIKQSEA